MADRVKCPTCGRSTPDESFCQYCGKPLYSCKTCNAVILKGGIFCYECGAALTGGGKELRSHEHVSWVWWLLPIICLFVGTLPWVGGVIAWALNRRRDPLKATNILWLGISLTVVFLAISIPIAVQTYFQNS